MMFASKTLRDLVTFDGDVCLRCRGLVPREGVHYVPDDGTLCECDILSDVVQHNTPNPILIMLREALPDWDEDEQADGPFADRFHRWLQYAGNGDVEPDEYPTEDQFDHARRVLTRLAVRS